MILAYAQQQIKNVIEGRFLLGFAGALRLGKGFGFVIC
jgi:hypothetical protein